jgi:hypothetical protein
LLISRTGAGGASHTPSRVQTFGSAQSSMLAHGLRQAAGLPAQA